MRIPPSLVVMSVVTAVPFGLAIRETLAGPTRAEVLDLTGENTREREMRERQERVEAQTRAVIEARGAEREAKLDSLYSKTVASPGAAFDGMTLGAPRESFQTWETRERVDDLSANRFVEISYEGDAERIYGVNIQLSQTACETFHDRLLAAWGPSVHGFWLYQPTHHRASFSVDDCVLRFDTYIDVPDLVAQFPVEHLGHPLVDAQWSTPGIGFGRGFTDGTEQVDADNRVNRLTVTGNTDVDTQGEIRDAISARFGAPAEQSADDPNVWSWKSKPPVRFDASGASRFSIQIGTPWQ